MKDIQAVKQFYRERLERTQAAHYKIKRKIHITGTVRLAVILLGGILLYIFSGKGAVVVLGISVAVIVVFLWLVLLHNKLYKKKLYLETSVQSDRNELKAIDYDYSAYDGASEQLSGDHPYSLDLDIFGDRSLFQSLNRTCTVTGKEKLAGMFLDPLTRKDAIFKRQQAIRELTGKRDLMHHFMVTGLLFPGKLSDMNEIKEFTDLPSTLNKSILLKILIWLIPAAWTVFIVLIVAGLIPSVFIGIAIMSALIIGESQAKKINKLQHTVGRKMKIFSGYAELIRILEKEEPEAEELKRIKSRFQVEGRPVSVLIKQLSGLLESLDLRFNVPARFILNPLFLWDIRKAIAVENWKDRYAARLVDWLNALGEYDALCSGACFSFTHPGYIYPEISETYFEMQGSGLGHPLLHRDVCVKNDIDIPFSPYFMIVTGANMAGKSTYLRTVGVNYLLGCMGFPVCADKLIIYPARLVTSLRTSDSLNDNESYFFAELKRLKMIIDRLEQGEKLFIILDEILKGTNSVDKQKGSLALIKQFISLKTCGIIATHDLLLGSLEEAFPENIRNMRFEADIVNDELYFSYTIKPGIAQNMNACFLMNKMGITVNKDS